MTQVKPIPDGSHCVTPHLICAGAADAIEFYKKAFNAVEVMRIPDMTADEMKEAAAKFCS